MVNLRENLLIWILVIYVVVIKNSFSAEKHINRICPPGWGVKEMHNRKNRCESCKLGLSYSSDYSNTSPCWPCSECSVGLYEAHTCTERRDTICDDCTRYVYKPEVLHNENFRKKCNYIFITRD